MKSIILIALLCATALAVPSKLTERKPTLVEILREKVAPKLTSFQIHKITPANLYSLLEDNNKPGLREVVEQFIASGEEIYNILSRTADRLVPFFQKYNLNEIIVAELPQIVQRVSLRAYDGLAIMVKMAHDYWGLSDETIVSLFIAYGIYDSAVSVPYYTWEELVNLINSVNFEAGVEFENISYDFWGYSQVQIGKFLNVLLDAIDAISVKQ